MGEIRSSLIHPLTLNMENVKIINKSLIDQYGKALDGTPKFRVVWSNDLYETRKGRFERYTEAGIYLGSYEGIQRAPKYTYIRDKYILEVYTKAFPEVFGGSILQSTDIVKAGDFYEPLRVFQHKVGNKQEYLPPRWDVCKVICDAFIDLINRPRAQRITDKIAQAEDRDKFDNEVAKFFDMLKYDDSDILSALRDKEGVGYTGKEFEG